MILRYGRGRATFDSNQEIISMTIRFRGNPFIMHKYNTAKRTHNTDMGYMFIGKGIVALTGSIVGEIFKYYGYMKILKCNATLSNGESVNVQVKAAGINLPELMSEYPEDISESPEKLRHTYTTLKKFKGRQYKRIRNGEMRGGVSRNRGGY